MRLRDWQSRLAACIRDYSREPFKWGENDCVLFAARCVDACTGSDHAERIAGVYSNAREAARLMASLGGLEAIASDHLGQEVSPMLAQAGDVGLIGNEGDACLGVFSGATWMAPGETGLVAHQQSDVLRVWRCVKGSDE